MAKQTHTVAIYSVLLAVGGGAVMTLGPELWSNAKLIFFSVGAAMCVVGIVGCIWAAIASWLSRDSSHQSKTPNSTGPSVTSHNQSGGTTAFNVTTESSDDAGKRG